MQNGLFRKVALERLSSPEQLDQLMRVTTPKGWLALVGLGSLLILTLLWGIFGTIETTNAGQGILIRGSGVQTIESPVAGQIERISVQVGEDIKVGQPVASVRASDSSNTITVASPYDGRVLEIRDNEGGIVQAGTSLLSLELIQEDLQVVLYLSPADGASVRPGMAARISPTTVRPEEYGVLLGKVVSVSQFPATFQGMLRVLGSDDLVRMLSRDGTPIEVRVEPIKADTQSGYQWSSPKGPPVPIHSGTFCTASIVIDERRPISLIFDTVR
jgi:multidrug efflux pump subunit AcrA (membrane-fusion protein)